MSLVRLGDVPEWIGALAAAGGLAWNAVSRHQRMQALDFVDLVQRAADVDGEVLAAALDDNAGLAEVFNRLWTSATTSSKDEKRRLLATIAAAALANRADDALLDELQVLADTADAVQPYHIDLLATMTRARLGSGQLEGRMITGQWTLDELTAAYSKAGLLLSPLLRSLETLGLVENAGAGTYDNQPAWIVTDYGRRLLEFLPTPDAGSTNP